MLFSEANSDDLELLTRSPTLLSAASKSARRMMITKDGKYIRYIKCPTLQEQNIAIMQDTEYIQYIRNPDESICTAVLERNGSAIRFIKDPTDEMYDIVFGKSVESLRCIKNISRFKLIIKLIKELMKKTPAE